MLFNSIEFAVFLPLVFLLYWAVGTRRIRIQNLLILLSSYLFYGWWDWRFLFLIFVSSSTDFFLGLWMSRTQHETKRKWILSLSLLVNLGLLGFFKYYNFFVESCISAFSGLGIQMHIETLQIILPVGISFDTFQTLSYTIDLYRRQIEPARDFVAFYAFVSFFPQLVAGPIERAAHLYPQFLKERTFNYDVATDGLKLILLGLFKKMVIADRMAVYVDEIFLHADTLPGSVLLLGAIYFAFQVYGDFSGYSDIAIGTAKLLGFRLSVNFCLPYFSETVTEYWRRWHISLATWIKDYLFNPLALATRSLGMFGIVLSLTISFTLVGLWHGGNWTFVVFGLIHGIALSVEALTIKKRKRLQKRMPPGLFKWGGISTAFAFWVWSVIFFRSPSLGFAWTYLDQLFSASLFASPGETIWPLLPATLYFFVEYMQRNKEHTFQFQSVIRNRALRWGVYYFIILVIYYCAGEQQQFIYFQF